MRSSTDRAGEYRILPATADDEVGLPEVGVELSAQVLEIAVGHLAKGKKYPQSYPRGRGGTLAVRQPEQCVAVNERLIRRMIFGEGLRPRVLNLSP